MDTKMIDTFFGTLKDMRGIAELDKHLLHALIRMQPTSVNPHRNSCASAFRSGTTATRVCR